MNISQKRRSGLYPQNPPLDTEELLEFLRQAPVAVISTLNSDGTIHSVPVWFLLKNGEIHFGTQKISKKIENITRDNRVSVLIDSRKTPYKGVLINGTAVLEVNSVIEKRIEVFSKYVSREKAKKMVKYYADKFEPIYVRIIPEKISSWDYSK